MHRESDLRGERDNVATLHLHLSKPNQDERMYEMVCDSCVVLVVTWTKCRDGIAVGVPCGYGEG